MSSRRSSTAVTMSSSSWRSTVGPTTRSTSRARSISISPTSYTRRSGATMRSSCTARSSTASRASPCTATWSLAAIRMCAAIRAGSWIGRTPASRSRARSSPRRRRDRPGLTMSEDGSSTETPAAQPRPDHPYLTELEAEHQGWYELAGLVRSLTREECLVPGYYLAPDWTVSDVAAHLGPWLAEAEIQLERMSAGTYEGHDIDIDALNAAFLEAIRDQPWDVA